MHKKTDVNLFSDISNPVGHLIECSKNSEIVQYFQGREERTVM